MERRLAAIMFVDIVGYTALMAESEAKGLRARERHRALVRPLVERYHGEAIEARGDESLAVFPTALDAVNCALAIEESLAGDGELRLHIGVHLGDFVLERGEVSGDAVNIAARIRSFSESGVCVSSEVYHSVRNQPNIEARSLGEHDLKNVGRPVALFEIRGTASAPRAAALRRAPAGEAAPIRSIAVLPLENLSGDPGQEYFADGMTEMLIGDLGNLRSLRVISRTSVMRYKGARKSVPEIAAELGVDGLLEGSVMREAERVRVSVQLIDGRTDHRLWSERYDRELRGVLELQSDVARAVARAIELALTPAEAARLTNRPRVDSAAHDSLLRGLHQLGRWDLQLVRSAVVSFERAIALDPGYALAHACLAIPWIMLTNDFLAVPHLEGMPRAKSAARRALELDPLLPDAHGVLGLVALYFDWDWPESDSRFRRALELNPSLPAAHSGYSLYLRSRGRHEEAIAEQRRAIELDPLYLIGRTNLATHYFYARRYDEALEEVRSILEIDPTFQRAHLPASFSYLALGRSAEAIGAMERWGLPPEVAAAARATLAREGGQSFLREMLRFVRSDPIGPRHSVTAQLHAQLGERDEAFAALERAYALRDGVLVFLNVDHRYDSLRGDPRFADLVRRIGIPAS